MVIHISSIPPDLIRSCELLTGRLQLDAVLHVISDYPQQIAEIRKLRSRLNDFDQESLELDQCVTKLKQIAALISEL